MTEFPQLVLGERGVKDRDKLWEVTRPDTYRALAEALTSPRPHIWDRLFWSEFVYWKLTNRECQFTDDDTVIIPQVIRALGAPVIWCLPPYAIGKANAVASHQMKGVKTNFADMYGAYNNMKANTRLVPMGTNLLSYNYANDDHEKQLDIVMGRVDAYLKRRNVPHIPKVPS